MTAFELVRKHVRAAAPAVWDALHPRAYTGAAGWCPADVPAASLGGVCAATDAGFADGPGRISCLLAGLLVRHRVPAFHVGRELLDAVARTDPPPGLQWTEMVLPFPAGVFLLPVGAVRDAAGLSYGWVAWGRLAPDEPVKVPGPWTPVASRTPALLFATASADDARFGHLNLSLGADEWPSATLPEEVPPAHEDGLPLSVAEGDVCRRLAGLAVGLLLAMTARPDLRASPGTRARTIKDGPAREEWTPNWVGQDYRVSRPAVGTHASPRLHWRRGHWRQQPHGRGRAERKLLWIDPILIGS